MLKIMALATVTLAVFGTPASAQQTTNTARADFVDRSGTEIGRAHITAGRDGVLFEVEISELAPRKWVALHIHETGTCDHAAGHETAGGHFNPDGKEHGFVAANGPHAGDLPNQYVGDDGVLRAQIHSTTVRLDDAERGIRDRALILHAGSDDYRTDPAGGAGDRIACAVIE